MIDLMKKMLYTGAGLGLMTKEKIEELAADLAKQAQLGEEEGRKLVDEMVDKSKEAKEDMEAKVKALVDKRLAKMRLASAEDVQALRDEVARLRAQLEGGRESGAADGSGGGDEE